MNSSVERDPRLCREIQAGRDACAGRDASTRTEHEVASGGLVIATIWWGLLAYAAGQALLSSG
jgi:hypothetical protein